MLFYNLIRANQALLRQKLGLIDALVSRYGTKQAKIIYQQTCPIVKASIGQHIRHSMDHMERVADVVTAEAQGHLKNSEKENKHVMIHYDTRARGVPDESDMDFAKARMERVLSALEDAITMRQGEGESSSSCPPSQQQRQHLDASKPLDACFMLSGDDHTEFAIPSTLARELGFVAHHAIHHLAMVRIIATTSCGLMESDISPDLGKAPSTIQFEKIPKWD